MGYASIAEVATLPLAVVHLGCPERNGVLVPFIPGPYVPLRAFAVGHGDALVPVDFGRRGQDELDDRRIDGVFFYGDANDVAIREFLGTKSPSVRLQQSHLVSSSAFDLD